MTRFLASNLSTRKRSVRLLSDGISASNSNGRLVIDLTLNSILQHLICKIIKTKNIVRINEFCKNITLNRTQQKVA